MAGESIYQLRHAMESMPQEFDGYKLFALPSPFDPRDYKYARLIAATGTPVDEARPATIDYRPNLPQVFQQGNRGSCVAAATAWTMKAFQEVSQGDFPTSGLSTAYIYTKCKQLDEIPGVEGTYPRVAMKVLQKHGVCPEEWMPYWTLNNLPVPKVPEITNAAESRSGMYKIAAYAQICAPTDTDRSALLGTIRQALAREGPFVLALLVCDNFKPDATGRLPLPEGRVLGGHAVGIVGDLANDKALILRNSWGTGWGQDGYALLPYEWITRRYDYGWYVFEAWTSMDMTIPRAAANIEVSPGARHIIVDGHAVLIDQSAFLSSAGRLMLPIRAMGGNMGYLVNWDGQKATLTKPS